MAKKYPLNKTIIQKENEMEITLSEVETQKVLEAGLNTLGFDIGTVADINVTQSRKTGKATIALEVNAFGIQPEPKVEVTHVQEIEETPTPTIETPSVEEEAVKEEAPLFTTSDNEDPTPVKTGDSLFG